MTPLHSIQSLLQQANEKGSRSTILRPLAWLFSICVGAVLGAIHEKSDSGIVILFAVFAILTFLVYLGTYVYCIARHKETLLRSETYSIQERLIEKGVFGDSSVGTFQMPATPTTGNKDASAMEGDK